MTPNKLPPLPEASDNDLPVPITYGMRRKGETAVIGVIPAKVHDNPPHSKPYIRDFEEVPLFTADQLHAARAQAFHDGQCEALRQSQSLPAGAVAGLVKLAEEMDDQAKRWSLETGEYAQGRCNSFCEASYELRHRVIALQADAREKGESPSLNQIPKPCAYPPVDSETGADTGSCCHHAYADGWNECRDEAIRLATQPAQASEKDNG